MTSRRSLSATVLLLLICVLSARADTITFVNGKSVQGRIVRKEGERVVILMDNRGRLEIPAARVAKVTAGKPEPKGTVKTTGSQKPAAEKGTRNTARTKIEPLPKVSAKVLAEVKSLIVDLGATEGRDAKETRAEARDALVDIGEPATGPLCSALEDAKETRRLSAAVALGKIGSKRSVRALLAAIYAGTPPKGKKAPWWEKRYLRACGRSFKAVTATSFDYDPDNTLAGEVAGKMLKWWANNYEKYPLQYGEELVEKTVKEEKVKVRPQALDDIKDLAKRRYSRPASKVRAQKRR